LVIRVGGGTMFGQLLRQIIDELASQRHRSSAVSFAYVTAYK